MEKEIKIKSISHDELMQILCDATCGNTQAIDIYVPEEFQHLKQSDTYEDNLADVLLAGGEVIVCDMYSLEDDITPDNFEPYNGNYVSCHCEEHEYLSWTGIDKAYVCCYRVNLQNLLDGWNNPEATKYLLDIENGNDDMYTGYNLIQIAVFGEIVYG